MLAKLYPKGVSFPGSLANGEFLYLGMCHNNFFLEVY